MIRLICIYSNELKLLRRSNTFGTSAQIELFDTVSRLSDFFKIPVSIKRDLHPQQNNIYVSNVMTTAKGLERQLYEKVT